MRTIRNSRRGKLYSRRFFSTLWVFVISLILSSCNSSGSKSSGLDTYSEIDFTVNGIDYQFHTTKDSVYGEYNFLAPGIGSGDDQTWPKDKLIFNAELDIRNFFLTNGIPDNTIYDVSNPNPPTTLNFNVITHLYSSANDTGVNQRQRSYDVLSMSGSQGTITVNKFIMPPGDTSGPDYEQKKIQFDIELDNIVLPAYDSNTGSDGPPFPDTITINHARFCKLDTSCGPKKQEGKYIGKYSGGAVTVISSNCSSSADNGPFIFDQSSFEITEQAWGEFKGTAIFQATVQGSNVVSTEQLTGTLVDNSLSGQLDDTLTIDTGVNSKGTGSFTGTINANNVHVDITGSDTSGDTCTWTASADFTK